MATDLEVAHQGLQVAEADLAAVADGFGAADTFIADYFVVEPGGRFLTQAGWLVDQIREQLGTHYRDLDHTLDTAVGTLEGIWHHYEVTDAQARLEFERAQQRYQRGQGFPPLTQPPPPITPHPQRPPATRSVDLASLTAPLADPQADTAVLDVLDTWRAIKDRIDQVLSFEWVTGPLQTVGLHVPLERFRVYMEGNYHSMAQAAAGFYALADLFDAVDEGTQGTTRQLTEHWSGRTSEAVQAWVTRLSGGCALHGRDLRGNGGTLQVQAEVLKLVLDDILDLLGDLADCLPVIELYGETLVKKVVHLAEGVLHQLLKAISVAARTVVKLFAKVQWLLDAVAVYLGFLASCGNQLRFPQITTPQAPR